MEAGKLAIGLHPASTENPAGRPGSTVIGLQLSSDIEEAVAALKRQGVKFQGSVTQDNAGRVAWFEDPDGTLLYMMQVRQWGGERQSAPAESPAWAGHSK